MNVIDAKKARDIADKANAIRDVDIDDVLIAISEEAENGKYSLIYYNLHNPLQIEKLESKEFGFVVEQLHTPPNSPRYRIAWR